MTGRASVWSSQELRELTREFVPCADEVWRLQNGTDGESLTFRAMADQGHFGGVKGGTRQGIYVSSPSGKLLASTNELDSTKVREVLETGLALWQLLPESERHAPADSDLEPAHRWESSRPAGGLVLVSVNRDLPNTLDASEGPAPKWNRDHVWLTRDEVSEAEASAIPVTREAENNESARLIGIEADMDIVRAETERRIADARTKRQAMMAEQVGTVAAQIARA